MGKNITDILVIGGVLLALLAWNPTICKPLNGLSKGSHINWCNPFGKGGGGGHTPALGPHEHTGIKTFTHIDPTTHKHHIIARSKPTASAAHLGYEFDERMSI
jgi:hypothetical protein